MGVCEKSPWQKFDLFRSDFLFPFTCFIFIENLILRTCIPTRIGVKSLIFISNYLKQIFLFTSKKTIINISENETRKKTSTLLLFSQLSWINGMNCEYLNRISFCKRLFCLSTKWYFYRHLHKFPLKGILYTNWLLCVCGKWKMRFQFYDKIFHF